MNSVVRYSHVVARSTRDLATLVFERQAAELNVTCLALSMIDACVKTASVLLMA
eukprot:jgi/Botrbrau1/12618/Bobra.0169s0145.1